MSFSKSQGSSFVKKQHFVAALQDRFWRVAGHAPTGRHVTVVIIDVFRVQNGKIVDHWRSSNASHGLTWSRLGRCGRSSNQPSSLRYRAQVIHHEIVTHA
jgi:hypothetical protein